MMLEHVVKFNFVDAGADPADAPLVCIPNLTQLRLRVSACSMLGLIQLMLMMLGLG